MITDHRHAKMGWLCALALSGVACCAGCNQTLSVTVDRIDLPCETLPGTYNDESATGALMRTMSSAQVFLVQVDSNPRWSVSPTTLKSIRDRLDSGKELLKEVGTLSDTQVQAQSDSSKQPDQAKLSRSHLYIECRRTAQEIASLLNAVTNIIAEQSRYAVQSAADLASNETVKSLSAEATRNATSGQTGFGGFAFQGVHMLSPGDPMYQKVLDDMTRGSAKPISVATAKISGDSTVIFVQENPTQMRVYSIDSDASRLSQNILLITDKALEAAVKYMAP